MQIKTNGDNWIPVIVETTEEEQNKLFSALNLVRTSAYELFNECQKNQRSYLQTKVAKNDIQLNDDMMKEIHLVVDLLTSLIVNDDVRMY